MNTLLILTSFILGGTLTYYFFYKKTKEQYEEDKFKFQNEISTLNERIINETNLTSSLRATHEALQGTKVELVSKIATLELEKRLLQEEKEKLQKDLSALSQKEPIRMEEHQRHLEKLATTIDSYNNLHEKIVLEKEKEQFLAIEEMKKTWSIHEENVKEKMQYICPILGVEYVDQFPYKGKPDNVVRIADEYIIFDAKSPQSDDLSNFPNYIKAQAEQIDKYTSNKDVKKDVFLVVPVNAIGVIRETHIQRGDQHVHVITPEALAPILRQLKKIESYTIVENLGPEEREKIVSVIGKMAYAIKRRIQIDQFFSTEFIEILTGAQNLPQEILHEALKVEKTCKLNPPLSRSHKEIALESLKDSSHKISGMVSGQGIEVTHEIHLIEEKTSTSTKEK